MAGEIHESSSIRASTLGFCLAPAAIATSFYYQPDFTYAGIFWLYIVLALFFSATCIMVVRQLPGNRHNPIHGPFPIDKVLSIYAALSFAALSANMLNILIRSYMRWCKGQIYDSSIQLFLTSIGNWSLQTKQFHEFVHALFEDQQGYVWSMTALAATFLICSYMGIEGKRYGIPKLWSFFGLSQILPISFTAALFFLAINRSPHPAKSVQVRWSVLVVSFFTFLVTITGCRALVEIERLQWLLMPAILSARSLLLIPSLPIAVQVKSSEQKLDSNTLKRDLAGLMITFTVSLLLQNASSIFASSWQDFQQAVTTRPAVSTLACDFLSGLFLCLMWLALPVGDDSPKSSKKR